MYMNKINSTDPLCRLTFVVIVLSNDTLKPLLSLTSCRNFLRSHLEVHRRVEWSQSCSCTSLLLPNGPPPSLLFCVLFHYAFAGFEPWPSSTICHCATASSPQCDRGLEAANQLSTSTNQNIKIFRAETPNSYRHAFLTSWGMSTELETGGFRTKRSK